MPNNAKSGKKVDMPNRIKSKLIAALSMLLVSAIMLISSTYAWFTLSTAPEIRGITTNVGANGNLEMALLNKDTFKNNTQIQSGIGDSMTVKDVENANETWGNLVDLASASYGLNKMKLMPSKLNLATGGSVVQNNMLLAPSYGSDGRVIDVKTPTYPANYDKNTGIFKYTADAAGVRALGTTSGVTMRISAYRAALANAAAAASNAQNAANTSLSANAQPLANIMMTYAQKKEAATFDVSYLDTFQSILDGIKTANGYTLTALRQIALAYQLSAHTTNELTDEQVAALITSADDGTIDTTIVTNELAKYQANVAAVADSQQKLDALKATNPTVLTWSNISPIFNNIVDKNHVTVEGKNVQTDSTDDIINAAATAVTDGRPVNIVFGPGSGIYYNIAELSGSLSVATKVNVSLAEGLRPISANALISVPVTGNTLIAAKITEVRGVGEPEETVSEDSNTTLSDTYGYAIDFAFRTNAASSKLQLQTAAAQRVYSDSEAALTQGSGSNMQFKTLDNKKFTVDELRALMSAIRVAFVAPTGVNTSDTTYNVLGIAKLDINATINSSTGEKEYTGGTPVGADGLKADLFLYNYTVNADGTVTMGSKKDDKTALIDLTQNEAKNVTVIVYLDGEEVDNTMVANANSSMTGALNLQFSSSATLVPMENASLRNSDETYDAAKFTAITSGDEYDTIKAAFGGTIPEGLTFYKANEGGDYYYSTDGKILKKVAVPVKPTAPEP